MIKEIVFLALSLFFLIKSADYATIYSSRLAKTFKLSEFIVSFFIVAVISALPETTISILSALNNTPEFGLGTLLGSNVADLTMVIGILSLFSVHGITIKSKLLRKDLLYVVLLAFPLFLGIDGELSRMDGILLIGSCLLFFYTLSIESKQFRKKFNDVKTVSRIQSALLFTLSVVFLLISSYYVVKFGVGLAEELSVPSVLIGLIFVALGTCLPELIFSIKAIKKNKNDLAVGDILGTVILDATLVVGITSLIHPFTFDTRIIYVVGFTMLLAGLFIISFLRSERILTKKLGVYLIFFYILFLMLETFLFR